METHIGPMRRAGEPIWAHRTTNLEGRGADLEGLGAPSSGILDPLGPVGTSSSDLEGM